MERILVLMAAETFAQSEPALRSARETVWGEARVSFGLCLAQEPDEAELAAMRDVPGCQFLCPARDPWAQSQALWQGESYVLLCSPETRFRTHWDLHLLVALYHCPEESDAGNVLTGFLPRPVDPVDAVSPVAAESFDVWGQLCFHRGMPLRYAAAPQPCYFLHPRFCFAPAAFFRDMAKPETQLSAWAYLKGWSLYTLNRPLLSMTEDAPLPPCPPETGERFAAQLARFEKRAGVRMATRQLSPGARLGLPDHELSFPLRVPMAVKLQEKLRHVIARTQQASPMCATCFVSAASATARLPEEYLRSFLCLSQVKAVPLTLYADTAHLKRLAELFPNTLEYRSRCALPLDIAPEKNDSLNLTLLGKPFLLAQTREKYLSQSHFIWIDFGYQRFPLYPGAAVMWDVVCQEKICLALVDGVPDTSMIVVPEDLLEELCRLTLSLCRDALVQEHRLLPETELWQRLMEAWPDAFAPVELPGKHELLSLTMLSREEEFHVLA